MTLPGGQRGATGRPPGDDGAALLIVTMMIMVAASVSVLLLGMVMAQNVPVLRERKLARTVHGAEAGISAMLSQIRASTTLDSQGALQGDRSKLPCGTLTGTVGGEQGGVGYSVTVRYFTTDPSNTSDSWRTANGLSCLAGYGPAQTPRYALVEAQGTGSGAGKLAVSSADRSLEAVYVFQLTNANVPGGVIMTMFGGTGTNQTLCIDALSSAPAPDAVVKVTTCDTSAASQQFAYLSNFSLVLTATQTAAAPAGMCISYDALKPTLVMRTCDNSNSQKWGFDALAQFFWPWSSGICMRVQTDNTSGSNLVADHATCGQSGYDRRWSWEPSPQVGAGNAGANQNQLVNDEEFGRCLDVTGAQVTATYMIDWPCKQDPTAAPGWNQRFTFDAVTGHLVTNTTYCLTTPASTGGYVVVTVCANGQASQRWTQQGSGGSATSYTIVDYQGRCLGLGTPYPGSVWSTIVVETCDGSTSQKWNAPPDVLTGALKNTRETTGQ